MTAVGWNALILAAGRGPGDPMAKAYGVTNKCVIAVGGVPMLRRVADALRQSPSVSRIVISIEDAALAALAGPGASAIAPAASAPASVMAAIASGAVTYPLLITTGDHALLTPAMVEHFCEEARASDADFCVGLARAETILAAYPQSIRTFFALGPDRVSGCNLFALRTAKGLVLLQRWQYLEQVRKKPWRLVVAFGIAPLIGFISGSLTLAKAFATLSRRLGLKVKPVIMPFAEAAIDVDKPADKELAEHILEVRTTGDMT